MQRTNAKAHTTIRPLSQWEQLAIEAALLRQQRAWAAVQPEPAGMAHLTALLERVSAGHLYVATEGR